LLSRSGTMTAPWRPPLAARLMSVMNFTVMAPKHDVAADMLTRISAFYNAFLRNFIFLSMFITRSRREAMKFVVRLVVEYIKYWPLIKMKLSSFACTAVRTALQSDGTQPKPWIYVSFWRCSGDKPLHVRSALGYTTDQGKWQPAVRSPVQGGTSLSRRYQEHRRCRACLTLSTRRRDGASRFCNCAGQSRSLDRCSCASDLLE
jgi:hypothetical protein